MRPSRDRSRPLELWAGIECTVDRVRDAYLDQVELTGHAGRPEGLARVADLRVVALRYPRPLGADRT